MIYAMAELAAVDYTAPDAEERFVRSLRETGFGVLRNHPVPQSVVQDIYQHWTGFFTSDDKERFLFDLEKYDGFFPRAQAETAKGHTVRDIKEYFHFYPWGRCPAHLKQELDAYYAATVEFAGKLLGWVERQTPADVSRHFREPLCDMIKCSEQSLLRVLYYPPIEASVDPGAIRAGAH